MNYTFGQLLIGDMFNTKAARWVKISPDKAIVVMGNSDIPLHIGQIHKFDENEKNIVLLYSVLLRTDF
jgi:predicted phosphodiesterase